ncbi:hypothetical protein Tco_0714931 [Tanacetum coccineum]
MAIGTGHRSNNYSESKRNDHLDNNRRQEQRNKVAKRQDSKALKDIFLECKDVSSRFYSDESCVWDIPGGSAIGSWAPEVYTKLGGRWGQAARSFTSFYRRSDLSYYSYWSLHLGAPNIESREVNPSLFLGKEDAAGPSLMKVWNMRKLWLSIVILGFISGDCGKVTTDDNEDGYARSIALEKRTPS